MEGATGEPEAFIPMKSVINSGRNMLSGAIKLRHKALKRTERATGF